MQGWLCARWQQLLSSARHAQTLGNWAMLAVVSGKPRRFQPSLAAIVSQVMAPRYAAGGGRDELDAELTELMGVVRLK